MPLATSSPRIVAQSEAYELVGILRSDGLRIYLDRFDTNEPVIEAAIAVTIGTEDVTAAEMGDGTFGVKSAQFSGEGPLELIFVITAPTGDDLLIGTLELPVKSAPAASVVQIPILRDAPTLVIAGPLPVWTSVNSCRMVMPSASAKRATAARCASSPKPDRPCRSDETL